MSWTYGDLATYDLLTNYGALEVTEVPTTPGRMTLRLVTAATLSPATYTALPSLLYDAGTYDAPNPYDTGPGTLSPALVGAARIAATTRGVATMRPTVAPVLPSLDYDDAGTYDAPNPYDTGPGTITPYGG